MRVAAGLAMLCAVLAGCSGGGDGRGDGDGAQPGTGSPGGPLAADGGLLAPEWAVGDWWSYGVETGEDGEQAVTTFVVSEDLGGDWRMDTDSDERAFQDARFDISRLGPQRKSDLAGSQGEDRVAYFAWPMVPGKTWTTRWDRQEVTVAVQDVANGTATLTARNATHLVYTYEYDAEARWFGRLDRHAPDGSVAFTLVLVDRGSGWTGEVLRYTLTTLVARTGTMAGPQDTLVEPDLMVPAGATDLWLRFVLHCPDNGGYAVELAAHDPTAGSVGYNGPCAGEEAYTGAPVSAPTAGGWSFVLSLGGGPTPPTYEVELLARTREAIPVG